jgi:hypothetical protein
MLLFCRETKFLSLDEASVENKRDRSRDRCYILARGDSIDISDREVEKDNDATLERTFARKTDINI